MACQLLHHSQSEFVRACQLWQDGIGNIIVEVATPGLKTWDMQCDDEYEVVCHVRVRCEKSSAPVIVVARGEEGEFTNARLGSRFALIGVQALDPEGISENTQSALQVLLRGVDGEYVPCIQPHIRCQEVLLPPLAHMLPASGHVALYSGIDGLVSGMEWDTVRVNQ